MESVCLEGDAGEFGGLAGDDDGVEGPRNDASRLMKRVFVCQNQIQWLVNAKLEHTAVQKKRQLLLAHLNHLS